MYIYIYTILHICLAHFGCFPPRNPKKLWFPAATEARPDDGSLITGQRWSHRSPHKPKVVSKTENDLKILEKNIC